MPTLKPQASHLPDPLLPIYDKYKSCTLCKLYKGKCNYVFYRGAAPCDVLFIGEAPGHNEDMSGLPFIGRSGQLLDSLIQETIDDVGDFQYGITNIVSCIPLDLEGNIRAPEKVEAESCRSRFHETIAASECSAIVLLGKTAKKYLKLPARAMIKFEILELQHPAYILRKGGKNSLEYTRNLCYLKEFVKEFVLRNG